MDKLSIVSLFNTFVLLLSIVIYIPVNTNEIDQYVTIQQTVICLKLCCGVTLDLAIIWSTDFKIIFSFFLMQFVRERERERERVSLRNCRYVKYNAVILVLLWEMCVKRQSLMSEINIFVTLNNAIRIISTFTVNQEHKIGIGSHVWSCFLLCHVYWNMYKEDFILLKHDLFVCNKLWSLWSHSANWLYPPRCDDLCTYDCLR
jgi:hypothetical protein